MSRTSAWMPLYVADYLADTRQLSTAEHGGYLLLLMEYWRAGPLPDDDEKLARLTGQDVRSWKKMAPTLRAFFSCGSDGKLHQKRIDAERSKAADLSEKRRQAGAQKGSAGPANDPSGSSKRAANAEQLQKQLQPQMQEQLPVQLHSHAHDAPATRAPGLHSHSQEAAKPLAAFSDSREPQPVRDAMTRIVNPSPNDPPTAWMHLADRLPDGTAKVELLDIVPGLGNPICGGMHLNVAAALLCEAAGLGLDWRGDWRLLIGWLRDGLDFHDVILPAVQHVASRPRYQPPSTLRYFESAVREAAGRMRA